MNNTADNRIFYILLFFAVIAAGFIFKTLSSVLLPVIISVMLSFVLLPIIKKLNVKTGIPWVISSILIMGLFIIVFFALFSLLARSLSMIVAEYPKYETKFMSIYTVVAKSLDLEIDESKSFFDNIWSFLKVREYVQKAAVFLSSGMVAFGKNLLSVALLSMFLLMEMRISKRKMHYAFREDKEKINRVLHQIARDTVNYISIKFLISLITGVLCWGVTWMLGMDFPVVWAFLAFIMNFIPIFGSIISVGITTLFSIIQFYPESIGKSVFILLFLIILNFTLGNILEPRIEGKNLGLSPFVILVCLSLWGYIWGFFGMILAVPMTVIIKIICENIDYLNSLAVILGNDPKKL